MRNKLAKSLRKECAAQNEPYRKLKKYVNRRRRYDCQKPKEKTSRRQLRGGKYAAITLH